ncbi:SDR family oxidoreductase [bacterium]|nr:SDR family oxidoreductase [bacterium]
MNNMHDFSKKIVLILGGTGSTGSNIADAFERSGATVCRHGREGKYSADLQKKEETEGVIQSVLKEHGRIDILVNAASAPAVHGAFPKKTWANYLEHLELQLKSAVESADIVVPVMKENGGGKIIHILSSYVEGGVPAGLSDYVTAKYALLGFTKALAKEVGRWHITVNAVSPSFIRNDFTKGIPEKFDEMLVRETPLGRLAVADDVSGAVLFLASPSADFITGETVAVTGGSTL